MATSDSVRRESVEEDALPETLIESLSEMYEKSLWTDTSFLCKDYEMAGETGKVTAHKNVLAARSPVFRPMFYGDLSEKTDEIVIADIDTDTFRSFLKYLYTDDLDLTEDITPLIMYAAQKYQVPRLIQHCTDYLIKVLCVENSCTILDIAVLYNMQSLKETVINFIDDHAEDVLKSDQFLVLSDGALEYVVKGDTLNAEEVNVVKAAMRWAHAKCREQDLTTDGKTIRRVLGKTFDCLRFSTLSLQDLSEVTFGKGLFDVKAYEAILHHVSKTIEDPSADPEFCSNKMRKQRMCVLERGPLHQLPPETFKAIDETIKETCNLTCRGDIELVGILISEKSPYTGICNKAQCQINKILVTLTISVLDVSVSFQVNVPGKTKTPVLAKLPERILLPVHQQPFRLDFKIDIKDVPQIFGNCCRPRSILSSPSPSIFQLNTIGGFRSQTAPVASNVAPALHTSGQLRHIPVSCQTEESAFRQCTVDLDLSKDTIRSCITGILYIHPSGR